MTPTTAAHAGDLAAARAAVRRVWGFDALRPLQEDAIRAALAGRDALLVLPTGGGKSLCYQVPPLVRERTHVVISPLISLMKDQVDGLRELGYPAAALHSGIPRDEQSRIERDLLAGRLRLLFAAPERLRSNVFLEQMRRAGVAAFAIDEAHCISHWGHDFRPDYRQLATLRARFPDAAMQAFTATATQRVRDDIAAQLRLRDPALLVGTFDRPNLVYRVVPRVDADAQVFEVIRRHKRQAIIVYCITRRETEALAAHLAARGVRAAHYHAGMEPDARRHTQDAFSQEKLDVVVATVAFGMGIDRSDVRCVIHAAAPKSIEHYQQETGRAGRDGLPAECVLLYSSADVWRWQELLSRSAGDGDPAAFAWQIELLGEMRRFASQPLCRHRALSEYFGQAYARDHCGACDVCLNEIEGVEDGTILAQKILSCVARVQERFGVNHVVEVLRGAKTERIRRFEHNQLSTFGLLREMEKETIQSYVYQLLDQGLLERDGGEKPILRLNPESWRVMRGQLAVSLVRPAEAKSAPVERQDWDAEDDDLFQALRDLRRRLAEERGVPAFVLFNDRTLREIARLRPRTPAALRGVSGIGERKLADLGPVVLDCVRTFLSQRGLDGVDAAAARPAKISEAKRRAFELFARGRSVDDVMEATQRARSTVAEYLVEFVAQEHPARIDAWVDDATYAAVVAAATATGAQALRPIFEHLGERVPYDQIKLVLRHVDVHGLPG